MAAEAARVGREGLDGALWQRVKKGVYGNKVRGLNSFENLCVGQAQAFFSGSDFLDFARLFQAIEKEEAEALIAAWGDGGSAPPCRWCGPRGTDGVDFLQNLIALPGPETVAAHLLPRPGGWSST